MKAAPALRMISATSSGGRLIYAFCGDSPFSCRASSGEGSHINLKMNGNNFHGFDYGTGSNFQGRVTGKTVWLYDYSDGQYFNYAN